MLQIYEDALAVGYEASGLRKLMAFHGPITAAKILIYMDGGSDGYAELWKLGRLDLSVEARALKPDFRSLSSESSLLDAAGVYWSLTPAVASPGVGGVTVSDGADTVM